MNSKNILSVVGIIALIEGIGFYLGAEAITKSAFKELTGNALEIGTLMHQVLGSVIIGFGILVLLIRNANVETAKKALNGVGFANVIFLAVGLKHLFTSQAQPPFPALALMVIIAGVSFFTAYKTTA